jgi:hypothetical protein
MVSRHRGRGARRAQNTPLSRPAGRPTALALKDLPNEDLARLPEDIAEAIEVERDNLAKAESVLACMAVSLKHDTDPLRGPYYPAVVQVVRELVARSIDGLEPMVMARRLRDKIEEDESLQALIEGAYALLRDAKPALVGCDAMFLHSAA